MNEKRGSWYLITGLVIGLIIGLVVSVWIAPEKFSYSAPQSLSDDYKSEYRSLIALSYIADMDLGRARARLTFLQDVNPGAAFSAQAQRVLASGGDVMEANALSILGQVLTKKENNVVFPTETPAVTTTGTE